MNPTREIDLHSEADGIYFFRAVLKDGTWRTLRLIKG
jgi:hypothetical protein